MHKTTPPMCTTEVVDVLKDMVFNNFEHTTAKQREALDIAINHLEQERPVENGYWIDAGLDGIDAMGIEYRRQKCSVCGKSFPKASFQVYPNYCNKCGSKMRITPDEQKKEI